jgi:hypothetical protein
MGEGPSPEDVLSRRLCKRGWLTAGSLLPTVGIRPYETALFTAGGYRKGFDNENSEE